MQRPRNDRARDEQVLHALALRDAGIPCAQIDERIGWSKNTTATTLRRIDRDYAQSEAPQ